MSAGMSAGEMHEPDRGPHEGLHDGQDGDGVPHGTFRSYMTGFVLSVVLTAVPFLLVATRVIPSPGYTAAIVLACALVQILVHMVFFLHLTPKAEGGWILISTVFTVILVVITLAGSLWIIFHLNRNMMPEMESMGIDAPGIEAPATE